MAYCATKFGVVGFTRALATEAGEVGVTLLVPGGMNTAFFDGRPEQYTPPRTPAQPPADVARPCCPRWAAPGCEVRELVVTPLQGVLALSRRRAWWRSARSASATS